VLFVIRADGQLVPVTEHFTPASQDEDTTVLLEQKRQDGDTTALLEAQQDTAGAAPALQPSAGQQAP
jgi:hypothetical protein